MIAIDYDIPIKTNAASDRDYITVTIYWSINATTDIEKLKTAMNNE